MVSEIYRLGIPSHWWYIAYSLAHLSDTWMICFGVGFWTGESGCQGRGGGGGLMREEGRA